ncbi:hypothetical protein FVEG_12932 [Fusarium verticillioides 7600]|uniref:Uncharacterized protein n=1 Tax=Gibberella moniliformis (strain M3125 / FGSC 7600) TaxID=334819 RepID=W7NEV9_GIBM7|nr:hypothetical protein FVEG_12932 [Fusarium verticillioides 7600]EWG54822.1 hypothetical protein FVEG_12932 [Fusarium verticillioides 7600]
MGEVQLAQGVYLRDDPADASGKPYPKRPDLQPSCTFPGDKADAIGDSRVIKRQSWCFFRISESAAQLNCWMNLPVQRIFAVSASCFIKSCHRWPEATGAWFRPRSQAVVREEKMRSLRRMSRSVVVKRMWLKFEAIFVTFLIILHAAE